MLWPLYVSRLLSSWTERVWNFSIGLFMVEMFQGSLAWSAIYGLSRSVIVAFLGPYVGSWIDSSSRWKGACSSLTMHNLFLAISALTLAVALYFKAPIENDNQWILLSASSCVVIFGAASRLAATTADIVVHKDWAVILSGGDDQQLAKINSTSRSISLAINVLAPIAIGQIMYFISHFTAAMCIAVWNFVSYFVEYLLLRKLYVSCPELAKKRKFPLNEDLILGSKEIFTQNHQPSTPTKTEVCKHNNGCFKSWLIYFKHDVRNAGLGLSWLHMTVLNFDPVAAGYVFSQGVSESILGILSGVGAGVGLLGSLAYPTLVRGKNVEKTGLYGFGLKVAFLIPCVASVWAPGSPFVLNSHYSSHSIMLSNSSVNESFFRVNETQSFRSQFFSSSESHFSIGLLIFGIIAARFGFWVADLSVNQILQNRVEHEVRGTINGVQSSVNMIFATGKYLMVILLPHPRYFGFLIALSFFSTLIGAVFYLAFCFRKRYKMVPTQGPTEINNLLNNGLKQEENLSV